jgi:histidinol dehydrogenase
LEADAATVITLATAEGLDAHADAVALRLELAAEMDAEPGAGPREV